MVAVSSILMHCVVEDYSYHQSDGVWCFLTPQQRTHFERFVRQYETVRQAEGRGSSQPSFYRELPFRDVTGKFGDDWRIRATSFQVLLKRVLAEASRDSRKSLKILDLGAGNCWLSNRLAQRGHRLAALDLTNNREDGLGAHVHFNTVFAPVQADFDHLPFAEHQFDVVIFNAAFHYSSDYETTLQESCRVLQTGGRVVIMDSPVYRNPESGLQMVAERENCFERRHGFPSNALGSENFLTFQRLQELSRASGVVWRSYWPFYGWHWALRPWKARLRGHREPARFGVLVGERG